MAAEGDSQAADAPADKKPAGAATATATVDRETSRATFYTSIDVEQEKKPSRARRAQQADKFRHLGSAQAGPRILEHHQDLENLAKTLDERMKQKLGEHKKEFFLAYKTHMYSVQSDMRNMKLKADHEEAKTREDARIRALEGQLEWFMVEALRLDEYCKNYKRDVDQWRAKAEALDEDRQFLEDQIKGAKRQNKVLNAAAERARSSAYSALVVTRARGEGASGGGYPGGQAALANSTTSFPPLADVPSRPSSARGSSEPRRGSGGASQRTRALQDRARTPEPSTTMPGSSSTSALGLRGGRGAQSGSLPPAMPMGGAPSSPASGLGNEAEERYVDAIKTLKSSITREQNTTRMLQASRATNYTQKSEVEEFFLKCIDEARKDNIRRKHLTPAALKGEQERMLEAVLGNQDVLVCLYEKLFPHRTGVARSLGGSSGDTDARVLAALPLDQVEAQVAMAHSRHGHGHAHGHGHGGGHGHAH